MYLALGITLYVRGGFEFVQLDWDRHVLPFTILHLFWIASFYIFDLYARYHFRISGIFFQKFLQAMVVNTLLATFFFYVIAPIVKISPKTNLFIYIVIYSALFLIWRSIIGKVFTDQRFRKRVLFVNIDSDSMSMVNKLSSSSLALYHVEDVVQLSQDNEFKLNTTIDILVVGKNSYHPFRKELYKHVLHGIRVIDDTSFWEELRSKIPLSITDTSWILKHFTEAHKREFEMFKRASDLLVSLILLILLSWLIVLISIAIKLFSSGPVLYRQIRVGKNGKPFTICKFRTMTHAPKQTQQVWAQTNDQRITRIGSLLRYTHLDELPQLFNVLKGNMSLIGPRPEQPEFVNEFNRIVPFYSLRHIVRPGVTGWAQINYPYGRSIEDTRRKLEYDLYYVKYRNWFLDFKILLKTFLKVIQN